MKNFVEQFDKSIEPLHKIWAPDAMAVGHEVWDLRREILCDIMDRLNLIILIFNFIYLIN